MAPALEPGRTVRRLAVAMGVALAVLGAWNWALRPDQPLRWLGGIVLLPAFWCALVFYRRRIVRSEPDGGDANRQAIARYADSLVWLVLVGACPLLVGYVMRVWTTYVPPVDVELPRRILTFSVAAMFVAIGNIAPKTLTPISMLPRGRAGRQQEARRFMGLTLVLIGLTLAASAVLAPFELVITIRRVATAVYFLAMLAAIAWMNVAPAQKEGEA